MQNLHPGKTLKNLVMDFVESHGPCTRKQIMEHIFEHHFGIPYNPDTDRGTLTSAFCDPNTYQAFLHNNYFRVPGRHDKRYLEKVRRGLYRIACAR